MTAIGGFADDAGTVTAGGSLLLAAGKAAERLIRLKGIAGCLYRLGSVAAPYLDIHLCAYLLFIIDTIRNLTINSVFHYLSLLSPLSLPRGAEIIQQEVFEMRKKEYVAKIMELLEKEYPDADCTLSYEDPLQLLIATQLAAQCTDARVNLVMPSLVEKYPDVYAFAAADLHELEDAVKSTGFYHNKARNIIACCQRLAEVYGGRVPDTMEELLTLAGVGRKTANLVLGDAFGKNGIVVDTHCGRLARRMGLTTATDPYKVEMDLLPIIPKESQSKFCHQMVLHGRAYCKSQKPRCTECPLGEVCKKKL